MQADATPALLPDPDVIRARIDDLDEERALLRKLLMTTVRIQGRRTRVDPATGLVRTLTAADRLVAGSRP